MSPLQHLFWAILNSLWQSAALAGIVFVLLRIWRSTAAQRYVVWAAVLFVCALLPLIDLALSARTFSVARPPAHHATLPTTFILRDAPILREAPSTPHKRLPPANLREMQVFAQVAARDTVPAPPSAPLLPIADRFTQERGATLFVALWAAGAFLFLLRLLMGYALLRNAKRALVYRELDPAERDRLRTLTHRPVQIGLSETIGEPCVIGFLHPVVSLPLAISQNLHAADLARVMRHECAHVSRWDDYGNLCQHLITALFWFNPIVHLVSRALDIDREIACDDAVASAENDRIEFAKCLYQIARDARKQRWLPAAGFARGRSQIVLRIAQLLDRNHRTSSSLDAWAKFAAATIVIAAVPFGYTQIAALADPVAPVAQTARTTHAAPPATIVKIASSTPLVGKITWSAPSVENVAPSTVSAANRSGAVRAPVAPVAPHQLTRMQAPVRPKAATEIYVVTSDELPANFERVHAYRHELQMRVERQLHTRVSVQQTEELQQESAEIAETADAAAMKAQAATAPAAIAQVAPELRMHGIMIAPRERGDGAMMSPDPDDFLMALHDAGFKGLSVDDLIAIRNAGVTASLIRSLRAAGWTPIPAKVLIKIADAGVDASYLAEARAAGFSNASIDDIIALRNAGVSGEFMQALAAERLLPMSTQEIVKLANAGVDARFVVGVRAAGYTNLNTDDLVRLRDAGMDSGYLLGLRKLGYSNVDVSHLIEMLNAGVTLEYIQRINASHVGGSRLVPVDDLIKLRNAGV